ncbi:MAG: transposase [Petrimonas sp.]|jgi:transposase|nr:transposase [Petrimonas sp.]
MGKQRTHFDKAFKANAVKLSLERKNVSELAQELGIAPFLLYRWRKEFQQKGKASFPGNGIRSLSEDAKRTGELEKRLEEAETERDILKKVLSIISKRDR